MNIKDRDKSYVFLLSESLGQDKIDFGMKDLREDGVKVGRDMVPVLRWESILSTADVATGNGTNFTEEDLQAGILAPTVKRRLDGNAFFNEIEHPVRADAERYLMVYDSKVSDRISNLRFETINNQRVLIGTVETATYSYGPELRKKVLSGSVAFKSFRGGGKLFIENGKQRKNLHIVAWDNVHVGADLNAVSNIETIKKDTYYMESARNIDAKGIELYNSADLKAIEGLFKPIDMDLSLIAESLGGFTPKKLIYDNRKGLLGFYSESASVYTQASKSLMTELDDFFDI